MILATKMGRKEVVRRLLDAGANVNTVDDERYTPLLNAVLGRNEEVLRKRILFLVLFCFVLFCFVLFCFVLFCFVLFCFVLFCFVLFCFVLFCFVLF